MAHHILIQGGLGAGKTFLMSLLAHHWRLKAQQRGGNVALFSNYGLKDSYPMTHYTDWYKVAEAQGSICTWDEAQVNFSNRRWSKQSSIYATELLMYTRKMQALQIYCTPSVQNVDSRIRDIVEVLITTRKIGDKGFSLRFIDFQTNEFMHQQFIPMWKAKRVFKLNLYDTFNMVQGFPLPNNEKQANDFFAELSNIHDRARGKVRA